MAKIEARAVVKKVVLLEFELPGVDFNGRAISGNATEYQLEPRFRESWQLSAAAEHYTSRCPRCDAPPGVKCQVDGKFIDKVHVERPFS